MLNFDNSYFYPEVRDGFYVSSKMKRTWAATLEVFESIKKICEDNNITYYADWGTMLGAVRHGGFIPWDDDMDICMKRNDYMRFIEIARDQLPQDYYLLSFYTDSEFDEFMARVVNRKEISFGHKYMREYHGYPYNVGVDIFPLDNVHDDEKKEKVRCDLAMRVYRCIKKYKPSETTISMDREEIFGIAELLGYEMIEGKPIRQQLYQMMDQIFSMYSAIDGHKIASVAMTVSYHTKAMPESVYDHTMRIPFENTDIVVPVLYDQMLSHKYSDYMKCIRTWETHQYPVYAWIEKEVHDYGRIDVWPNYTIKEAQKAISIKSNRINHKGEGIKNQRIQDVVFMPYRSQDWKWLEPFWLELQENSYINTIVMPIPYYDKDEVGEMSDFHYEGRAFPEYVPIVGFDQYDLEKNHPSTIVIQNPYDNYDTGLTIPPFFYTERIKEFTDNLCYITNFVLDEFSEKDDRAIQTMDFFCTVPGIINADEVYVQSDNMRIRYIEKLVSFAGEDTRELWENIVKTYPWERPVTEGNGIAEDEIPEDWWPKILNDNGEGKKLILYYTNPSDIAEYGLDYTSKVTRVFEAFHEHKEEISVIWLIDDTISQLIENYKDALEAFNEFRKKMKELTYVIEIDNSQVDKALAICDAYYGDKGHLMHRFTRYKRPTMIQNVSI